MRHIPASPVSSASPLIGVDQLAADLACGTAPILLDIRWKLGEPSGYGHGVYAGGAHPGRALRQPRRGPGGAPRLAGRPRGPAPAAGPRALRRRDAPRRRAGRPAGRRVRRRRRHAGRPRLVAAAPPRPPRRPGARRRLRGLARSRPPGRGGRAAGRRRPRATSRPPGDGVFTVSTTTAPPRSPRTGRCSTPAPARATAARPSRSTRRPAMFPGAVSAPTTENLAADGRFLPAEALAERFAGLGVEAGHAGRVAVYCGSGVTADARDPGDGRGRDRSRERGAV